MKFINIMILIAVITMLFQLIIVIIQNDFSVGNMAHVIGWGTWLFILLILKRYNFIVEN